MSRVTLHDLSISLNILYRIRNAKSIIHIPMIPDHKSPFSSRNEPSPLRSVRPQLPPDPAAAPRLRRGRPQHLPSRRVEVEAARGRGTTLK